MVHISVNSTHMADMMTRFVYGSMGRKEEREREREENQNGYIMKQLSFTKLCQGPRSRGQISSLWVICGVCLQFTGTT